MRKVLRGFVENVIWDAITIAGEQNWTTVPPSDVVEAMTLKGRHLKKYSLSNVN